MASNDTLCSCYSIKAAEREQKSREFQISILANDLSLTQPIEKRSAMQYCHMLCNAQIQRMKLTLIAGLIVIVYIYSSIKKRKATGSI